MEKFRVAAQPALTYSHSVWINTGVLSHSGFWIHSTVKEKHNLIFVRILAKRDSEEPLYFLQAFGELGLLHLCYQYQFYRTTGLNCPQDPSDSLYSFPASRLVRHQGDTCYVKSVMRALSTTHLSLIIEMWGWFKVLFYCNAASAS